MLESKTLKMKGLGNQSVKNDPTDLIISFKMIPCVKGENSSTDDTPMVMDQKICIIRGGHGGFFWSFSEALTFEQGSFFLGHPVQLKTA